MLLPALQGAKIEPIEHELPVACPSINMKVKVQEIKKRIRIVTESRWKLYDLQVRVQVGL